MKCTKWVLKTTIIKLCSNRAVQTAAGCEYFLGLNVLESNSCWKEGSALTLLYAPRMQQNGTEWIYFSKIYQKYSERTQKTVKFILSFSHCLQMFLKCFFLSLRKPITAIKEKNYKLRKKSTSFKVITMRIKVII